jgi:2,3-bisphosphoglycerate-dependent phosphoglycerate mutase
MKKIIALFLFIVSFAIAASAEMPVTTVILVRHAEKVIDGSDDPTLTEAGQTRAERLALMLLASNLKAIYSSQWARSRLTAVPTAKEFGLQITQVDANESKKLVNDILLHHAGQTVLVVGHSDTLSEIVHALGGGPIPDIGDNEYDNLFVLSVYAPQKAFLLILKY